MDKKLKVTFIFLGSLFLIAMLGNVFSEDIEPDYQYDSLDRLVKVTYSDGESIRYEYHDLSDIIKKIFYTYGGKTYVTEYDYEGNIIRDEEISYRYDSESNLKEAKDKDSRISYDYYPNGDLKSDSVFIDGKKFTTNYKWNDDGFLIEIDTLVDKLIYEYDETGEIIKETLITQLGDGTEIEEVVLYEYDDEGYLTVMEDGYTGEKIKFGYETIEYDCEEAYCKIPCSGQDECFPIYDCSENGNCQETSCFEIDFRAETCSYKVLKNKTMNNYTVWYEDLEADLEELVYNANSWDSSYKPNIEFNEEGYLVHEEGINYEWAGDSEYGYYLSKIGTSILDEEGEENYISFGYDDEGYLEGNSFVSEFEDMNVKYSYDVFGRIAYEEPASNSYPSGLTASVIKILGNVIKISGKAVSNPSDSGKIYYYGSEGNSIPSELYYYLISPDNIWPELAEYYVDACLDVSLDGRCIPNPNFGKINCFDSDEGLRDIFSLGYVDYYDRFNYDYCKDSSTLVENYCGKQILRLDLWNWNIPVAKQKEVRCQFGCSLGKCLENENPECSIDSDCSEGSFCSNGQCVIEMDLPEEPKAPGIERDLPEEPKAPSGEI